MEEDKKARKGQGVKGGETRPVPAGPGPWMRSQTPAASGKASGFSHLPNFKMVSIVPVHLINGVQIRCTGPSSDA